MLTNQRLKLSILCLLLATAAFLVTGCGGEKPAAQPQEQRLYTCGMHPQVIQNKPGNCPICGMKLTPIRKPAAATADSDARGAGQNSSVILIDPVTVQNMGLRTALVQTGALRRTVRTVGVVDFDETALTDVTTKFRGWIVKLLVDTTGQQVHQGEPLFEIYSPELYSAQAEYLLALNQQTNTSAAASEALRASALAKLSHFDVSDGEIATLATSRQVKKAMPIHAPRDGIVVEKMAVEGQMVEAGMRLYRLADLGTVWVQSQVYEQDLPLVRVGQEAVVSLSYMADRKFRGRVTYIYPTVDEKTRTVRVRMEFHNPGYFLKPGMFATVQLVAEVAQSAILAPDMAILRSGEKNTVFVALDGGRFEARHVVLGLRGEGDYYQILSGLAAGERIVVSGQFLLDSESQLREAILKMGHQDSALPESHIHPELSRAPGDAALAASEMVYICPMPEHVALEYEHPGKCSLCSMALVPVSKEMLARVQPGGQLEHYTCPMPEHSNVKESKTGKCPRCGMTLIPVMVQPPAGSEPSAPPSAKAELPPALYTCPMAEHGDVVSDQPGTCSKCEMKLVEVSKVRHRKAAEENWRQQHRSSSKPAAGASAAPQQ